MEEPSDGAAFGSLPEPAGRLEEDFGAALGAGAVAVVAALPVADVLWTVFKQSALYQRIDRWRESTLAGIFARVRWLPDQRRVEVRGIDFERLLARTEEAYGDRRISQVFGRKYKFFNQLAHSWRWQRKLTAEDVSYLSFHHFFALEAAQIFSELADATGLRYYEDVSAQIWRRTWLRNFMVPPAARPLDTSGLRGALAPGFQLLPHQEEFVRGYPSLKLRLDLRGVVLSFDQGLGKTITACALAECLGKRRVYIVCPNSLRENWLAEVGKYFARYRDPALLASEVYAVNVPGQRYSGRSCRFVIVNNEALDKLDPLLGDSEPGPTMLVVDEGQNFRNLDGLRTRQLISLRERTETDDVLVMSGTPIKAAPAELVPALRLVDRLFDDDAARTYARLFDLDEESAAGIVRARFGRVIYRRTKAETLDLPPKTEVTLRFPLKDPTPYLLETVKARVGERFAQLYDERLAAAAPLVASFRSMVLRAAPDDGERARYLRWAERAASGRPRADLHELTQAEMETYAERKILPGLPPAERKAFGGLYTSVVQLRQSAMGTAIGEIVPAARRNLYLELWRGNTAYVLDDIRKNPRKTVLFTVFREVAEAMQGTLEPAVGSVLVYGGTRDRQAQIDRFRGDDDVNALVATSQTLGTGATLVEADKVFFFGQPWRRADFDQAADRVHRIGQTHPVTVATAVLDDPRPNLSSRMQEVMEWSGRMFGSMIGTPEGGEAERALGECAALDPGPPSPAAGPGRDPEADRAAGRDFRAAILAG